MSYMANKAQPAAVAAAGLKVTPSGRALGADIAGFDFDTLDSRLVAALRSAWLEHGVVRFRSCNISDEQQMRLTAQLGDFVKHPRQIRGEEGAHDKYEEILVIGNGRRSGVVFGTMGNAEARWHSDTFIKEQPAAAALLRAVTLPSAGGDTWFCNMYRVYDDLPKHLKRILDGRMIQLDTVWNGPGRLRAGCTAPEGDDFRVWPHIRHPIVRTHGETGRNCLYIGAKADSAWIVGLPLDENREILDELTARVARPEYHWVQVWEQGDMIMWDNRCTMHRRDGWAAAEERVMHRTTTRGEKPYFAH